MSAKATSTITSHEKHPSQTQDFIAVIQEALYVFEDEITSLSIDICGKAYQNYVEAYRDALIPVWNLARLVNVDTIMKTITDKELKELTVMAKQLKTYPPRTKVTTDKTTVPDLKTITQALMMKFPDQSLPNTDTCTKIGEVFSQLNTAHKAYSKAAEGLAELSTLMTPEQFTLLLTATTLPTIQLIIPGHRMSPLSTLPPPKPKASTASGRSKIMNFTKLSVLPNPDSEALLNCDKNLPTRVLEVAIYYKLEKHYFDETRSRMDIATAFHCNTSRLSKAVTGIDYKSGPHHYGPQRHQRQVSQAQTERYGQPSRDPAFH